MGKRNYNFKKVYKYLSIFLITTFIFSFVTAGAYTDQSVIDQVRSVLKSNYVDALPDSVLNLPTVDEIINEINKTDTHTTYFTADTFTDFTNSINNTFTGIGVQIEMVPEGVQILTVFDGSPAEGAGMKPGDIIVMADQHILAGLIDSTAVDYIKGPEGTTVKLKIKRGNEILSKDIVRKQINAPTVDNKILDSHIGYIAVTSFGTDTATKFGQALTSDESKKVDSYIVDLRYNGGGYLSTALDMAGYFIGNQLALITRSRVEGELKQYGVLHKSIINKPVIFLLNEYSASASEVLSGAVKDYNKAYFLGVQSYGKGSVQMPVTLSNNDVLKLTIEKFYSPKDKTIDKVGITPDLNVPDDVDSMRVAELILDTPKTIPSNKGYVKISVNNKTIISKLTRLEDPAYWTSYKQLINLSTTQGAISLGTDKGWTTVSKTKYKDIASMYYPTYKEQAKLTNMSINATFTVKFDARMLKSSLNSKNVELIDTLSGARVPVAFDTTKDKELKVSPNTPLIKGKEYCLVVNPAVKKSDNKTLGYGILDKITIQK